MAPASRGEPAFLSISHIEHLPPSSLSPYVEAFWEFDVRGASTIDVSPADAGAAGSAAGIHDGVPAGATGHLLPLAGAVAIVCRYAGDALVGVVVVGPSIDPVRLDVRATESYRGVRFRPEGAGALLGIAVAPLRDRVVPAAVALRAHGTTLREQLAAGRDARDAIPALTTWLESRALERPVVDPIVVAAIGRMVETGGKVPVTAVAGALGVSPRQLLRRFREATGLTPGELSSLARARRQPADLGTTV